MVTPTHSTQAKRLGSSSLTHERRWLNMAKYTIDEFLGIEEEFVPIVLTDEVDKKIDLLYDLCILRRRKRNGGVDEREELMREILLACPNTISIDNAVHGVIVGKYTLDQLLKSRGYLQ
jgi:hypothetical protein